MRPSRAAEPLRRMLRRLRADEAGNAALEFLTAGVILLVPLVYLGLALSSVQAASLAAEGAAREAARVYVSSASDAVGRTSADRAVTVALADRNQPRRPGDLSLSCAPRVADCLRTGERITAHIHTNVQLPFVPAVFGLDRLARVPLEATASAPIFHLRGTR